MLTVGTVVAMGAYGLHVLQQRAKSGALSCLPSDFPKYPGAAFYDESYDLNENETPGYVCTIVFRTQDGTGEVFDFYSTHLQAGEWNVVTSDSDTGRIEFKSIKKKLTNGSVVIAAGDGYSQFTVLYYSP